MDAADGRVDGARRLLDPAVVEEPGLREGGRVRVRVARGLADADDGLPEPRDVAVGEVARFRRRVEPRGEEHVVADPVAHAADDGVLVEEHGLDRRVPLREQRGHRGRGRRRQRVGREQGHGRRARRVAVAEEQPPEAARVRVGDARAVVERQLQLAEPRRPRRLVDAEGLVLGHGLAADDAGARHAEVDQQRARRAGALELEPELLAAPPRADARRADEEGFDGRFVGALGEDLVVEEALAPAAALLAAVDGGDAAPDDALRQHAPLRLGLRQLGHGAALRFAVLR